MNELPFISIPKKIVGILKAAGNGYLDDHAIKLSASLSFYTIFSMPALLIIVIYLCGLFFGKEAVQGDIFWQIDGLVGKEAALQIQDTIKNVNHSHNNNFIAMIGIIVLVIGASGVFSEMQTSIDHIWGLKAKPKLGFKKFIKTRLMSFSMIGTAVFLLLVCLIINMVIDLTTSRLNLVSDNFVRLTSIINHFAVFIIIAFLFTFIFKSLPDGKIGWKYTFAGGACSSFFFLVGKFIIGLYLGASHIATIYGTAGSVIVILVWVYYSANILYFGAEIVKAYVHANNQVIIPNDFSVRIETKEIEVTK